MTTIINKIQTTRSVVDAKHPWLGLEAYTEETQAYFFGRDAEISEMFTRVRDNTLTILFGQSGLGKTSLLGAGLVPKLRVECFRPVLLRLDFSEDAPPLLAQTRDALCGVLRADTQSPASSLWEILHRTSPHQDGLRAHPPVIIFDQFEELFTQGGTRPGEVAEWFTQISDLVENRPPLYRHDSEATANCPASLTWRPRLPGSSSRCARTIFHTWSVGSPCCLRSCAIACPSTS